MQRNIIMETAMEEPNNHLEPNNLQSRLESILEELFAAVNNSGNKLLVFIQEAKFTSEANFGFITKSYAARIVSSVIVKSKIKDDCAKIVHPKELVEELDNDLPNILNEYSNDLGAFAFAEVMNLHSYLSRFEDAFKIALKYCSRDTVDNRRRFNKGKIQLLVALLREARENLNLGENYESSDGYGGDQGNNEEDSSGNVNGGYEGNEDEFPEDSEDEFTEDSIPANAAAADIIKNLRLQEALNLRDRTQSAVDSLTLQVKEAINPDQKKELSKALKAMKSDLKKANKQVDRLNPSLDDTRDGDDLQNQYVYFYIRTMPPPRSFKASHFDAVLKNLSSHLESQDVPDETKEKLANSINDVRNLAKEHFMDWRGAESVPSTGKFGARSASSELVFRNLMSYTGNILIYRIKIFPAENDLQLNSTMLKRIKFVNETVLKRILLEQGLYVHNQCETGCAKLWEADKAFSEASQIRLKLDRNFYPQSYDSGSTSVTRRSENMRTAAMLACPEESFVAHTESNFEIFYVKNEDGDSSIPAVMKIFRDCVEYVKTMCSTGETMSRVDGFINVVKGGMSQLIDTNMGKCKETSLADYIKGLQNKLLQYVGSDLTGFRYDIYHGKEMSSNSKSIANFLFREACEEKLLSPYDALVIDCGTGCQMLEILASFNLMKENHAKSDEVQQLCLRISGFDDRDYFRQLPKTVNESLKRYVVSVKSSSSDKSSSSNYAISAHFKTALLEEDENGVFFYPMDSYEEIAASPESLPLASPRVVIFAGALRSQVSCFLIFYRILTCPSITYCIMESQHIRIFNSVVKDCLILPFAAVILQRGTTKMHISNLVLQDTSSTYAICLDPLRQIPRYIAHVWQRYVEAKGAQSNRLVDHIAICYKSMLETFFLSLCCSERTFGYIRELKDMSLISDVQLREITVGLNKYRTLDFIEFVDPRGGSNYARLSSLEILEYGFTTDFQAFAVYKSMTEGTFKREGIVNLHKHPYYGKIPSTAMGDADQDDWIIFDVPRLYRKILSILDANKLEIKVPADADADDRDYQMMECFVSFEDIEADSQVYDPEIEEEGKAKADMVFRQEDEAANGNSQDDREKALKYREMYASLPDVPIEKSKTRRSDFLQRGEAPINVNAFYEKKDREARERKNKVAIALRHLSTGKRGLDSYIGGDDDDDDDDGGLKCDDSKGLTKRRAPNVSKLPPSSSSSSSSLPSTVLCCCGCGVDASSSHHYCSITGMKIMAWCSKDSPEVFGSKGACTRCSKEEASSLTPLPTLKRTDATSIDKRTPSDGALISEKPKVKQKVAGRTNTKQTLSKTPSVSSFFSKTGSSSSPSTPSFVTRVALSDTEITALALPQEILGRLWKEKRNCMLENPNVKEIYNSKLPVAVRHTLEQVQARILEEFKFPCSIFSAIVGVDKTKAWKTTSKKHFDAEADGDEETKCFCLINPESADSITYRLLVFSTEDESRIVNEESVQQEMVFVPNIYHTAQSRRRRPQKDRRNIYFIRYHAFLNRYINLKQTNKTNLLVKDK